MPSSPSALPRPAVGCLAAAAAVSMLACAASPPPSPAYRAPGKAPTAATDDPWRPVVLDSRAPSPVAGIEWARVQPDGRTVALLPAGASGGRAMVGATLFPGDADRLLVRGEDGEMELYHSWAKARSLGQYEQAFFCPGGQILAWDSGKWGLFTSGGELLRGAPTTMALTRSGLLVERTAGGITRLVEPPSNVRSTVKLDCQHFYPAADRAICVERVARPHHRTEPYLHVLSLETGEDLLKIEDPDSKLNDGERLAYGFNRGASKLAAAMGDVRVLDVATGKWSLIEKGTPPPAPYRSNPKVAFTADERHVCVEEDGRVRIAPSITPARGTGVTCLFAPRKGSGWIDIGLEVEKEWDAFIVTFPITPGFVPIRRSLADGDLLQTEALSLDAGTAVVLERSIQTQDPPEPTRFQALVLDAATGAVRRTVPLGEQAGPYFGRDSMWVSLSPDGHRLSACAAGILPGATPCRSYDARTGNAMAVEGQSLEQKSESGLTPPRWGSLDVSFAATAPGVARAGGTQRILSRQTTGPYLSLDLGTDAGVEVHVNVPGLSPLAEGDIVSTRDGSALIVAANGSFDVWSVQPIAWRARLARASGGAWVAFFLDGTFEVLGEGGEEPFACERDGALYPAARCASKRRPAGWLRTLISGE